MSNQTMFWAIRWTKSNRTTLSLLNYDSSKDKEEWKTMTPEVYSSIMNVANDDSLELYSSVKIQKARQMLHCSQHLDTNITKVVRYVS